MSFRFANHADVDALVALVESAYRGEVSKKGWTTEADLLGGRRTGPDDIQACLDNPHGEILCYEEDGRLKACAFISQEDGAGYFGMFSVSPELQGSGIGKQVLAESERVVRDEWKLPAMRMTVIDCRDELIAFYERRGYALTGIKKPFPYGDERFGIPKRDDLQFEIMEKIL